MIAPDPRIIAAVLGLAWIARPTAPPADDPVPRVEPNDNRTPAGVLRDGVLTLDLEVRIGEWFPEADDGLSLTAPFLAEVGRPPQVPAPFDSRARGDERRSLGAQHAGRFRGPAAALRFSAERDTVDGERDTTDYLPWRRMVKDGADLPASQAIAGPGTEVLEVGEMLDVGLVRRAPLLWAAAAAFAATSASPAAAQSGAEAWWAHVEVLAHDSMLGRHTGSPQHRLAAEYVAGVFRSAGLAPGGTEGYFQPVRLILRHIDESGSSLALVRGDAVEPLVLGRDAYFSLRAPLAERVEAPVVFAGYGLRVPEYGHDDLAGLDVRGKIVAYLSAPPAGIPGPVVSDARSRQWARLHAAGAVGTIVFFDATGGRDLVWRRAAANRLIPQMMLADSTLDALRGQQTAVVINARQGAELFRGTPHTLAALAARADSGLPLPRFALPVTLRAVTATATTDVVSDNVAGILRGTDAVRRDEYVVLTAHLDHVGVSTPVDGDSIYNGAMDNASGTATLLEAARALARQRPGPARSIVFLAVTAEEKGLLGSRYWAEHPTVPAEAVVANLNTDMFLPINPLRSVIVNGIEESDLADDVRSAAAAVGLAALTDPEPERNAFVRSDQYSFIRRGIPAVSLKAGFTRGTPEHLRVLQFRAERYHAPSDDPSQPVDLQAAAEFNRFYVALVRRVADRGTRPEWNADSYFRTRPGAEATGQ